jgi:hypothetical protein
LANLFYFHFSRLLKKHDVEMHALHALHELAKCSLKALLLFLEVCLQLSPDTLVLVFAQTRQRVDALLQQSYQVCRGCLVICQLSILSLQVCATLHKELLVGVKVVELICLTTEIRRRLLKENSSTW